MILKPYNSEEQQSEICSNLLAASQQQKKGGKVNENWIETRLFESWIERERERER